MPEIDKDLARHCLASGRGCPIMRDRNKALAPQPLNEECVGMSIRDTLFEFCVQAQQDLIKASMKQKKRKFDRAYGQAQSMAYAVALIDNPYMPDWVAVLESAKKEAETR